MDEAEGPADQPDQLDQTGQPGERASRLALVLAAVLSVLILGLAVLAPLIARALGYERAVADLSAVQTYDIDDRLHSTEDLDYPQTPPAGGAHAPIWLDCGSYDEPVRDEAAVHDLEHGSVWLTYAPSLSEADVARLVAVLPDNAIMSPHENLPSPVVVTVWGAQLALDGAGDERLALFLDKYGDGHTAPEKGATCHGGTSDPSGAAMEPGIGV